MKVGVIGTGKMGENHVRTYLSLRDECQLIGIYDQNKEKGYQISQQYNIKQFQTLDSLLQSVEAVSIAVPTASHYDVGITCIEHKVHLLMEKPITSTVAQAKDLINRAHKAKVKLQVGHIELFNPFMKHLMKEMEYRKVIGIEMRRMGLSNERMKHIDVVKDLMIHDLYLLQEMIKRKITTFYAFGRVIENTPKHAVVMIKFPEQVTAALTASFESKRKIRTIQIVTEDALIEANFLKNEIQVTNDTAVKTTQLTGDIQPLQIQLFDFLRCIKFDKHPTVSGYDGLQALLLSNKISEAMKEASSKGHFFA